MSAPELVLEALGKTFHRTRIEALRDCSLGASSGECVAILGASGCGKTTLLRTVAGLETPNSGRVLFNDRDVTHVPAQRRGVGFVFQHDALFAHASVYENIAFGLRARHVDRREIDARVRLVARHAHADTLLDRRASTLSGGERQRVALARALAPEPAVLLLDEPLSRLDAQLRTELRHEFGEVVRARAATILYVTHDQQEAIALGDRIAVMRSGRIAQIGTARELFERPVDCFVAEAVGSPSIAFVPAVFVFADADEGERCGLRASAVSLAPSGSLHGIVTHIEDFIDVAYASVAGDFGMLIVRVENARPFVGERVSLAIDRSQALCFSPSGTRIESPVRA